MRKRLLFGFGGALTTAAIAFFVALPIFGQTPGGWLNDSLSENLPAIQVDGVNVSVPSQTLGEGPSVPPPPPGEGFAPMSFGGSSSAPDEITPEIAALTQGVINGPGALSAWKRIFLFVTNQIEYEHYYGCKKGALLTYIERKGGDADLATLLVAMLRSAGYTARYGYGMVAFLTNHPEGFHVKDWLGLPTDAGLAYNFSLQRGFPAFYNTFDGAWWLLPRVWVEVDLDGTWQQLDPAFKKRVRIAPAIDVAVASGYDRTALKSAAGGTPSTNAFEGIDYTALGSYLAARATALLGFLDTNNPGTDAVNLVGGWRQEPFLTSSGGQYAFTGAVLDALS